MINWSFSIFYDLIPLIHPDLYLNSNHAFKEFYLKKINKIKELDGLLSISLSSKNEAIKYLGFEEEKVYNISSACNTGIFNLNKSKINISSDIDLDILDQYILYSGASDPRKNIKGLQFERWNHAHGCRKWFNIVRDTSNDKIKAVYKMGEEPPTE